MRVTLADHGMRQARVEDANPTYPGHDVITFGDLAIAWRFTWMRVLAASIVVGLIVFIAATLLPPTYTARATLLPPRQQQAAAALSSLGVLAGEVGSVVAHTAEQYASFLGSQRITQRIVDRFKLAADNGSAAQDEARRLLLQRVRFDISRKDGLLIVEVNDRDSAVAAAIANAYVEELQQLTRILFVTAVTERRAAMQRELDASTQGLAEAQAAVQRSGFDPTDLRADNRATADEYSRLQSQLAAAEVRLQSRAVHLSNQTPEVQLAQAEVAALRTQLARHSKGPTPQTKVSDLYTSLQRAYRVQEQAHASLLQQVELLRLEEVRGPPPIPLLDAATVPERPSAPRRTRSTLLAVAATAVIGMLVALLHAFWRTRPAAAAALR